MKSIIVVLSCILLLLVSCQDKEAMAELDELKALTELEEQNKALIENYIEAWNVWNIQLLDEFLDPQFQIYVPSNSENPLSLEQHKEWIGGIYQAFPDIHYDIQEIFASGDKVCLRWTCTATYKLDNLDGVKIEKRVIGSAIETYRVQDGKILEEKSEMDALGWNQQLAL